LNQAFRQRQATDGASIRIPVEDGVLSVMTVMESRAATTYLVINSANDLRDIDSHMIDGMLQIYRNFCQLLQESQTDSLTGLANRKTFDECFSRVYELQPFGDDECSVEVDQRRPTVQTNYWLAMVDIDHFKLVNDRFGHLYGDEVLILLAHLLKNAMRNDDLVFRFGGEEFVLMIRCQSRDEAAGLLERLRKSVESQDIPQVGQVTISMGATEMIRNTFAGTLLDYADKALYYSKQNGRNRLTFFEDMISQGLATREVAPSENLDFF
jgi:diguanylate cyclase (GGDEF)-like protein